MTDPTGDIPSDREPAAPPPADESPATPVPPTSPAPAPAVPGPAVPAPAATAPAATAPAATALVPPGGPGRPGAIPGQPGFGGQWPLRIGDPIPPGWMPVPNRSGYIQPRVYTPPPPGVLSTHWKGPLRPAATAAISAIGIAGLIGAIALVGNYGLGWVLVGAALAAVGLIGALVARRTPTAAGPVTDAAATDAPHADNAVAVAPVEAPADTAPAVAASETGGPATDATTASPSTASPSTASPSTASPTAASPSDAGAPASLAGYLRRYGERAFWAACSLALLSVTMFRDAGWLVFWSVIGFLLCGVIALAGGRTVKGFAMSAVAGIAAPFAGIAWLSRGIQVAGRRRGGARTFIVVVITLLLVIVFGALFAGADAEFNQLVKNILPKLSAVEVVRAVFCFVLITLVATGVGYIASARPTFDSIASDGGHKVRRVDWVVPLTVLNLLFVAFDAVQVAVFFNGDAIATKSKAYMKGYAHTGFGQLVAVTILTLTVLAVAYRLAPRATRADRVWFRVLLGGMSVLSLVIVAAALKRVASYEAAFGYTRLRVVVAGIELWVGLVFAFVFLSAMLLRAGWLPRVIAGSLAVALFAGALVNPDGYVAQRNVDRYLKDGKFSIYYNQSLSADAVPALMELPDSVRMCSVVYLWVNELDESEDWRSWNYSRAWARNAYRDLNIDTGFDTSNCPDTVAPGRR